MGENFCESNLATKKSLHKILVGYLRESFSLLKISHYKLHNINAIYHFICLYSILMSAINTNTTTAYAGYGNTPLVDTYQPSSKSSVIHWLQPATTNYQTKQWGKSNWGGCFRLRLVYVNATEQHEYIMYCFFIVHLFIVDANAPEYHKLDRGKERSKVKTSAPWPLQNRGGPEDYSLLTFD